jgi:two-component system nitrate/nitrite response regulator NarL
VAEGRDRIRVLVADDHPVYREGLVDVIKRRPDLELVGEAGDGREALEAIYRLQPDVAVLDMRMPGLDATDVLNAIRRDGLDVHVLVLSAYQESSLVYRIVAAGAGGYMSKDSGGQAICDAIVAVTRGTPVASPEVSAALFSEIQMREARARPALTERQREILQLTAEGGSAAEIAERLQLSAETVRSHLHNLYERLGVTDRAAAVAEAIRHGLIE